MTVHSIITEPLFIAKSSSFSENLNLLKLFRNNLVVNVARILETINEEDVMTDDSMTAQKVAPAEEIEPENNFPSELVEPRWSVITYEAIAARGLTYPEAEKLAARLKAEKVSGICIITDEAAERVSSNSSSGR
jgi:hypothetical protein